VSDNSLIQRHTEISANLVSLCRFLRDKGYGISSTEESDAMKALTLLPPSDKQLYHLVLRSAFAKTAYQYSRFEEFLLDYEAQAKRAVDDKIKSAYEDQPQKTKNKKPSLDALKSWLYNAPTDESIELPTYSNRESLVTKEFVSMSEEEIQLVIRVLREIGRKIARRKSRLKIKSRRRKTIDLKTTIRKNLRYGLEIRKLHFARRKVKPLKLVVLADVSKSMDLYSRFFIQMIYAFQNSYDKIETFVFSTVLYQISEILDNNDFDQAFSIISERIPQWSGGTKIGACLSDFYENHGHHLLNRKTIVIILSDGWDTGEPDVMKDAMRNIKKLARRIIWLNPLAGHAEFEPEVIGLKSAMPYVDNIYPAHNLLSLKKVLGGL